MERADIVDLLKKVEIFRDLHCESLNLFAGLIHEESFRTGELIIRKGEDGNSMYILSLGKVKIHDGEHLVAVLETGNFFGEFSLLDSAPRSMSVTALEDVSVITITRDMFFNLLNSQPELAKKIISTLTSRLRQQNLAIIEQLKSREEELTRVVEERTYELKLRNAEISIKNKEITDNLNYAKDIQAAILPDKQVIYETLKQSFILFIPKDIVSGDFFAYYNLNGKVVVIAADCTGHGVSGAFLSVIGNALLNQLINERRITDPALILDHLNEEIIKALNQRNSQSNDGMDISVCVIDLSAKELIYAGANRPLWLIRNDTLMVFKADKFPVGGIQIIHDHAYTNHTVNLEEKDTVYIFTDGFADQFGGENGKKLMTGKFKELLIDIQRQSMPEQEKYLNAYFNKWKGDAEQVDDVLIIGIRI